MAFQFLCPQGHLLQAEDSQAGQQMQGPYCGGLFVVPRPVPAAAPAPSTREPAAPPPAPRDAPWQPAEQAPGIAPPPFQPPPFQPPGEGPPTFQAPAEAGPEEAGFSFPGIRTESEAGHGGAAVEVPSEFKTPSAADLPIVHVVCPNGHELETPREMLDQEALCPFCQVQFRLRLEDSLEYREEKAKAEELREIRVGQLWLRWAIAAAAVVVLGLVLLIVLSALR
jgi:hypothetical protein